MSARAVVFSVLFVAAATAVFVVGEEWESAPGGLFVVWLAVHFVYGLAVASFWALAVTLVVPAVIAPLPWDGSDTELWVQAAFAEGFYGIPFVLVGVIARRLWQVRRPPELPQPTRREEPGR